MKIVECIEKPQRNSAKEPHKIYKSKKYKFSIDENIDNLKMLIQN